MDQLAALSVRSRGTDVAWSRMRQLTLSADVAEAANQAAMAAFAGDMAAQVAALEDQIAKLDEQLRDAEELTNSYAVDVDHVKTELLLAEHARDESEAKADALRYQIGQMALSDAGERKVTFDDVPVLDQKDASETFRFLEEISKGRIAFTPNAALSWKKSSLTNYAQMTDALVRLALLANTLYDDSLPPHDIDRRTDDWIQAEFGITVSFHDSQIETHKKAADSFTFEGKQWNNVPHVKVTDAVAWTQVARIHFDQDAEGGRIVVNHVGNKLYK